MNTSKNTKEAARPRATTEPYTVRFGVVMNPSSNFHTGSVLLLTATVVCGALGITLVAPMLQRDTFAHARIAPSKKIETIELADTEKFSEFYPTVEDGRKELKRLEAAAGPLPRMIRETRLASAASPASRYLPPKRTQVPPAVPIQQRRVVQRLPEPATFEAPVEQYATGPDVADAAPVPPVENVQFYSPQQLPAGTVYAPVTVNVDSSSLAEQMLQMSTRFEELIEQKHQAAAAAVQDAEKKQLARKQRQRNRPSLDPESQQQIVRIEAGLQQLAESVNALQSRTRSEMGELELQKNRAEAASKLLETYERTLTARLQSIEASHAELRAPSKVALAPQETYSDAVPFPKEAPVVESLEFVPEQALEMQSGPLTEPLTRSFTAEDEVEIVASSDPEVASTTEQLPISEPIEAPLPEPKTEAVAEPLIEIMPPDAPPEEPVPEDEVPLSVVLPPSQPQALLTIPDESLLPIPSSTLLDITPPATAPPVALEIPALPSVGYEHVYRFKLADVESESAPTVVPGDGPVCQHCGLIHVPGQKYAHQHLEIPPAQPKKIQTVSNTAAKDLKPQPVASTTVVPTPVETPKTVNRTGGRGFNRHVQAARQSESEKPVWDVELPSFGAKGSSAKPAANSDRPSFMHRVGATFKQFTR